MIFGGVGSGLYGMLSFAVVSVFIAGLMVGRTPEYLGKKIEAREIKYAAVGALFVPTMVLTLTALSVVTKGGLASIFNPGAHGFSEALYAYTSQSNNNGSAFAGYASRRCWRRSRSAGRSPERRSLPFPPAPSAPTARRSSYCSSA